MKKLSLIPLLATLAIVLTAAVAFAKWDYDGDVDPNEFMDESKYETVAEIPCKSGGIFHMHVRLVRVLDGLRIVLRAERGVIAYYKYLKNDEVQFFVFNKALNKFVQTYPPKPPKSKPEQKDKKAEKPVGGGISI